MLCIISYVFFFSFLVLLLVYLQKNKMKKNKNKKPTINLRNYFESFFKIQIHTSYAAVRRTLQPTQIKLKNCFFFLSVVCFWNNLDSVKSKTQTHYWNSEKKANKNIRKIFIKKITAIRTTEQINVKKEKKNL